MSTDLHAQLLDATGPLIAGTVLNTANLNGPRAALRAVVELHAPVREGGVFAYFTCSGCDNGSYAIDSPDWPCSTIRVIADALGVPIDKSITEKEERRG